MRAFHNDPTIKEKYLLRVHTHRIMDEVIKGTYWEYGKGCAVGCTIHSSDHAAYETELGIPQVLAHLEDTIFENLPNGKAKEWPERFLSCISVGVDLTFVWPKFAIWLLTDPKDGVLQYAASEKSKKVVQMGADLYTSGGTKEQFIEVARAASAAVHAARAASAAVHAAEYAAESAAYAAAYTADYAAANAARAASAASVAAYAAASAASVAAYAAASAASAAEYAANAAAYATHAANTYIKFSDKLVALIGECN